MRASTSNPMPVTSDPELTQRAVRVAEWMLVPLSSSEIARRAADEWKVCRRTAFNYMKRADEMIAEETSKSIGAEIAKAKSRLERVMRKAEESGDLSAAIAAQREIIKMLGLAEPQKQEIAHKSGDPVAEFLSKLVNSPDVPRPLNEAGDSSL